MNAHKMLWVEKYRPKTIDDVVLPESIKTSIKNDIASGNIPHYFFYGSSGIGKTTLAYAIANEINADVLFINGSLENGIDILRDKISQFASTVSMTGDKKIVLIDEADNLRADSFQPGMRAFMEQFSDNVRFILTANYKNKIIPAIQSRCTPVQFKIAKTDKASLSKQMYTNCTNILKAEGVTYDNKTIAKLVQTNFPDFRQVLMSLQTLSAAGHIDDSMIISNGISDLDSLVDILRDKKFNDMREWVSENIAYSETDVVVLLDKLYDAMDEKVMNESMPSLILILADYSYKSAFVVNQQINMAAMFTEIMSTVEWK